MLHTGPSPITRPAQQIHRQHPDMGWCQNFSTEMTFARLRVVFRSDETDEMSRIANSTKRIILKIVADCLKSASARALLIKGG